MLPRKSFGWPVLNLVTLWWFFLTAVSLSFNMREWSLKINSNLNICILPLALLPWYLRHCVANYAGHKISFWGATHLIVFFVVGFSFYNPSLKATLDITVECMKRRSNEIATQVTQCPWLMFLRIFKDLWRRHKHYLEQCFSLFYLPLLMGRNSRPLLQVQLHLEKSALDT